MEVGYKKMVLLIMHCFKYWAAVVPDWHRENYIKEKNFMKSWAKFNKEPYLRLSIGFWKPRTRRLSKRCKAVLNRNRSLGTGASRKHSTWFNLSWCVRDKSRVREKLDWAGNLAGDSSEKLQSHKLSILTQRCNHYSTHALTNAVCSVVITLIAIAKCEGRWLNCERRTHAPLFFPVVCCCPFERSSVSFSAASPDVTAPSTPVDADVTICLSPLPSYETWRTSN